jgi:hypothetical protein
MARIRAKSSHMDGFSCLTPRLSVLRRRERQRRGRHRHIEHVVAEPVDVLGLVGTQGCDSLRADRVTETVGRDTIQRARHADRRVEDEQIGDEVVVFDHLALLVAGRRSHEPATPEPRPLRIAVEVLALIGGGADRAPEIDRSDVAEQEGGADRAAEFAEREVEPVLAAVGSEPAQNRRRQQPARLDR